MVHPAEIGLPTACAVDWPSRAGERFVNARSLELVGLSGSVVSVSSPFDLDSSVEAVSYAPDAARKAEVDFVIAAINRDSQVGSIPDGRLPEGSNMVIRASEDSYQVSVVSAWMESSYRVAKGSGAISEAMHAHLEPDEFEGEEEEMEIIIED